MDLQLIKTKCFRKAGHMRDVGWVKKAISDGTPAFYTIPEDQYNLELDVLLVLPTHHTNDRITQEKVPEKPVMICIQCKERRETEADKTNQTYPVEQRKELLMDQKEPKHSQYAAMKHWMDEKFDYNGTAHDIVFVFLGHNHCIQCVLFTSFLETGNDRRYSKRAGVDCFEVHSAGREEPQHRATPRSIRQQHRRLVVIECGDNEMRHLVDQRPHEALDVQFWVLQQQVVGQKRKMCTLFCRKGCPTTVRVRLAEGCHFAKSVE